MASANPHPDRAQVQHLLRTTPLTQHEIATQLGVSQSQVSRWAQGIERSPRPAAPHPRRDAAQLLWTTTTRTQVEIAAEVGAGLSTVAGWCRGITRPPMVRVYRDPRRDHVEELLRTTSLTRAEIATEAGASLVSVNVWARGIARPPRPAAPHPRRDAAQLLWTTTTLTAAEIAAQVGAGVTTVRVWCRHLTRPAIVRCAPRNPRRDRVEELLRTTSLTQADIAAEAGVSLGSVWKWGEGIERPPRQNIRRARVEMLLSTTTLTLAEIAVEVGVALGTVCRWAPGIERPPTLREARLRRPIDLERTEADLEALAAEIEAADAYADRTWAEYVSHFRRFAEWCAAEGFTAWPAEPVAISAYTSALVYTGVWAPATAEVAVLAISAVHEDKGLPSPVDISVRETLAGLRKDRGRPPTRVRKVGVAEVRPLVANPPAPRPNTLRDRALLLLGAQHPDISLRQLAETRTDDVRVARDGQVIIDMPAVASDPARQLVVTPDSDPFTCAARALRALLASVPADQLVFGVSSKTVHACPKEAMAVLAHITVLRREGVIVPETSTRGKFVLAAGRTRDDLARASVWIDPFLVAWFRARAVALFCLASGLRPSEVALLRLAPPPADERRPCNWIVFRDAGIEVNIGRRKNDPQAYGLQLGVKRGVTDLDPVRALEDWLWVAGHDTGYVFPRTAPGGGSWSVVNDRPMGRQALSNDIARLTEWAGEDRATARSLRVGYLTDVQLLGGATPLEAARRIGTRSVTGIEPYFRGNADPFVDNVAGFIVDQEAC